MRLVGDVPGAGVTGTIPKFAFDGLVVLTYLLRCPMPGLIR